jgi:hypothetical protein
LNDEVITANSLDTKAENAAVTSSDIDTQGESRDDRQMMNGSLGSALSMDTNRTKYAMEHITNENVECNTAKRKTIRITNVTAKWIEDLPKNTLTDVSLDVRPGELLAVVGPVGSGKVSCTCVVRKGNRMSSAGGFVHRGDLIMVLCNCCRHHCCMLYRRNCPSVVAPSLWVDQYHTPHRSPGCSQALYGRTSCLGSPWTGTGTDKWSGSVLLNRTSSCCPMATGPLWGRGVLH